MIVDIKGWNTPPLFLSSLSIIMVGDCDPFVGGEGSKKGERKKERSIQKNSRPPRFCVPLSSVAPPIRGNRFFFFDSFRFQTFFKISKILIFLKNDDEEEWEFLHPIILFFSITDDLHGPSSSLACVQLASFIFRSPLDAWFPYLLLFMLSVGTTCMYGSPYVHPWWVSFPPISKDSKNSKKI